MHLPHLRPFKNSSIVFITTCTHRRQSALACSEAHATLRGIWSKSAQLNGWFVGQYLLMPDHVHLFAYPGPDALPLAGWMQLWKSIATKGINRTTGRSGTLWQEDYFDRFIRSLHDYAQKWDYIALNPVRRGLILRAADWPYRGVIHDLRHHATRD